MGAIWQLFLQSKRIFWGGKLVLITHNASASMGSELDSDFKFWNKALQFHDIFSVHDFIEWKYIVKSLMMACSNGSYLAAFAPK